MHTGYNLRVVLVEVSFMCALLRPEKDYGKLEEVFHKCEISEQLLEATSRTPAASDGMQNWIA